jgi:N-acetyl-anhydromuramyl-L-alanine amidase AmpD
MGGIMSITQIKNWQTFLKDKGYYYGTIDGDFGNKSLTASMKVAEKAGLLQPSPEPIPTGNNPFTIKNHLLYKNGKLVENRFSPNHGGIITPEIIVIHYTGDNSLSGAISWLCSPQSKVSAHLIVGKDGVVWQLLPLNTLGWHAGVSSYDGRTGVNSFSIGIENVGIGDNWPDAQILVNKQLVEAIKKNYNIKGVVGHEDVAPGRKSDPGPNYPWNKVLQI